MKNQDKLRDAIEEILLDSIIDSNRVEKFPCGKAASQLLSLFEKEINEREKELLQQYFDFLKTLERTVKGVDMHWKGKELFSSIIDTKRKRLNLLGREGTK